MKILLVRPPHCSPLLKFLYSSEPLGLESVAAAVPEHEVQLFDMRIDRRPLSAVLSDFQPDVVGTSGFTPDVPNILRLVKAVRQQLPSALIVVGGHHATIAPEDFDDPVVDAVVIGLGEETFREVVQAAVGKREIGDIPGLAVPTGEGLGFTPTRPLPRTLDDLPLPNRELNRRYRQHYTLHGSPLGMIGTARGCPYRCKFCSIVTEMKGRFITKSPKRVIEELGRIDQPFVRFADGNTFGNPRRMWDLAEGIRDAGVKKRYLFDIRSDTVTKHPDLIAAWRQIGLEYVAIGLESSSDEYLQSLNKDSSVSDNVAALAILRENGVKALGQFMIDPAFEEEDFERTIAFVLEHDIHLPTFLLTTPFPGTALFDEVKDQLVTRDYEKFDCVHALTPTKLDKDTFFRCFFGLYEKAYSMKRLGRRFVTNLARGEADDVSVVKLAALRLIMGLKKGKLGEEFSSV